MTGRYVQASQTSIYRLGPLKYVHILDQITNVTRVEVGPITIVCKQHETIASGPHDMITIQPRHYVLIENPVEQIIEEDGSCTLKCDDVGQTCLKWGERAVRLAQHSPFPLYPGEKLVETERKLEMIYKNTALHLQCTKDFTDINIQRKVGDEWLFEGPARYIPNTNVRTLKNVKAIVIKQDQALHLRAIRNCTDRAGTERVAGEEWLIKTIGAYIPSVTECKINILSAYVLTDKKALHIRAKDSFVNKETNIEYKTGEQWLVTNKITEAYIPTVYEEITKYVTITTLTSRQYCIILNPWNTSAGKNEWGNKKLVIGECSFFLYPGEYLMNNIENVYILTEEQGLVLKCNEAFTDTYVTNVMDINGEITGTREVEIDRKPGERWLIRGPMEFIPPIGTEVLRKNNAISLGENEGVYVRDITTGVIRAVIGQTYLLNANEQLWEKELPQSIEELLATDKGFIFMSRDLTNNRFMSKMRQKIAKRDKTRVIRYDVPHNHCVQVYDVKEKRDRVVFGPVLVLLQPGEVISPLTLSGGKPKKSNCIKCLHLRLGPEFSSDVISVETSDHCRLRVALSYNWQFDVSDVSDNVENSKLFAVQDFIGDMCKCVSSLVRAAVSGIAFDKFHTTSAKLIRSCVFGVDGNGKVLDEFYFHANNLKLTGIDIRSIEPEDKKTRSALQRSVQQAIEISAQAQESLAKAAQKQLQQEARGKLQKQKLVDQAESEIAQKKFFQVQAETRAVEQTGKARAQAQSEAEMIIINAQQSVDEAQLHAQAQDIKAVAELDDVQRRHTLEIDHLRKKNGLSVLSATNKSDVECLKFESMCHAIGSDTLRAIGQAGPELKMRILKELGLDDTVLSSAIPFIDV